MLKGFPKWRGAILNCCSYPGSGCWRLTFCGWRLVDKDKEKRKKLWNFSDESRTTEQGNIYYFGNYNPSYERSLLEDFLEGIFQGFMAGAVKSSPLPLAWGYQQHRGYWTKAGFSWRCWIWTWSWIRWWWNGW